MTDLLVTACRILEDPTSTPALRTTAAEALVLGMNEGLTTPRKAAWLVWSWMKTLPSNRSWRSTEKLGGVPDEDVRADALGVLDDDVAGDDLRDVAVDVLAGDGHAKQVGNDLLLRFVDRARTPEQVRHLVRLIEAVHHARGLSPGLLRAVRDRWASSSSPPVREAAVDVSAEIAEPDLAFVERMLGDPNANVRVAVAHRLELGLAGAELGHALVEARLRVEVVVEVRSALLRVQAALLEESPRKRRRV